MNNEVAVMTKKELESLMYLKAREANNDLYGGLIPYINRLLEDNRILMKELEYIKTHLQMNCKKSEAEPVPLSKSVTSKPPKGIAQLLNIELSKEQKKKLAEGLKPIQPNLNLPKMPTIRLNGIG